jgi:pyruvate/2-oxoglutarate dehydrogenase complex dihydrolipoamide dehydrogenase (E3) component
MLECRYLIIGGGQSGLILAKNLGKMGLPTILVEQSQVGGTYLHTNQIPKSLLERESRNFGDGLLLFKDYPTTFNALLKHRQKIPAKLKASRQAVTEAELNELKQFPSLQIIQGGAEFVSKSIAEVNSQTERHLINFQEAFICVGRNVMVKPEIKGLEKTKFLHQHDIYLLQDLPKSLGIIGVSAHTLEVADIYSRLGIKVYMFEQKTTQNCLSGVDRTGLNFVYKKLLTRQVEIQFQSKVAKVQTKKDQVQILLQDGQTFDVSHLYVPASEEFGEENLGLSRLGIKFSSQGIQTDSLGRCTTAKHIWAFGDCAASTNGQNKLSTILNQVEKIQRARVTAPKQTINLLPSGINAVSVKDYRPGSFKIHSVENLLICLGLSEKEAKAQFGPQAEVEVISSPLHDGFLKIIYRNPMDSIAGLVISGELVDKIRLSGEIAMDKKMSRKDFLFSIAELIL